MSLAIFAVYSAVYFGVGGWAVWRVNRLLPQKLTFAGRPLRFGGWGARIFVWAVVFLVATAFLDLGGRMIAMLLE